MEVNEPVLSSTFLKLMHWPFLENLPFDEARDLLNKSISNFVYYLQIDIPRSINFDKDEFCVNFHFSCLIALFF